MAKTIFVFSSHSGMAVIKLLLQVLPFFHAYHGSLGRVAAFSSSVTKIQRLKDCIEIFGMPYCDLETRDGKVSTYGRLSRVVTKQCVGADSRACAG